MEKAGNRLQYLLQRYLSNTISEEEFFEFWMLLKERANENSLSGELQFLWENAASEIPGIPNEEWNSKMKKLINETEYLNQEVSRVKKISASTIYKWAAAASVAIILFVAGFYFYKQKSSSEKVIVAQSVKLKDISPGGNKAMLQLSNGSTIALNSTANGTIAQQGNSRVLKVSSGHLAYNATAKKNPADIVYNTLSTPRGGQYQLTLEDGTKVWLNSASSIRFPTAFTGKERNVEITGEAYFEVAKNKKMPFIVSVNEMKVKVLGTHFNIMAYDDEPDIKTTLLEGAVKITKGTATALLTPGQQAQLDKSGNIKLIKDIDVNTAVAWMNNLFWFKNDNIQAVMRQLSRWYDVDVIIQGNIPQHFSGSIPRNVNVSRVFEILEKTGSLQCEIKNRQIIVSP